MSSTRIEAALRLDRLCKRESVFLKTQRCSELQRVFFIRGPERFTIEDGECFYTISLCLQLEYSATESSPFWIFVYSKPLNTILCIPQVYYFQPDEWKAL